MGTGATLVFGFTLETTAGNDILNTGRGDDTIFGSLGSDTFDAGEQVDEGDTLTYENLTTGVRMSVLTAGDAENPTTYQVADLTDGGAPQWADQVKNFETHVLTPQSDLLELSVLPSDIFGLTFDGGDNDNPQDFLIQHYVDAGNTVNTLSYDGDILSLEGLAPAGSALVVDLDVPPTPGVNEYGDGKLYYDDNSGNTIYVNNFEGVLGTDGADKFYGNDVNNLLFGFIGNDTLVGREGQDMLVGDQGDDKLYGGIWNDLPGVTNPLDYQDDGIRDLLLGGGDNDTYYVSNNDQIWDMTLEQMEKAVPGGPNGSMTLASDGNGTVYFNGIQLGEAEWIKAGEAQYDGFPRQSWVDYSGAGATVAVFKDFTSGFVYRVFSAVSYVGAEGDQEVRYYVLGVEDWNTQTVFEIGNVAYDPDTHTLGFPTQSATQMVATSSLITSTTETAVEPVTVDLSDAELGLIRAIADTGEVASFDDALSAALAGLTASEGDGSAVEPTGGAEAIEPSSNGWRGQWEAGAPSASNAPTSETVETSTVATIEATATTGSYLGISFYEPDPIDGTTGDDDVRLTQGDDIYDAGPGNDIVKGRNGNDVLRGGTGDDILDGGNNDDILEGGPGSDTLIGGNGIDTADYYKSNDGVSASLVTGNAFNSNGNITWIDSLDGIENLAGSSLADRLRGDSGDNVLTGRAGDDWLTGNGGNDVFDGGLGNDRMDGGAGNDLFSGGAGHDQMTGNGGSDVFDGGEGQDTVLLSWITSGDAAVIDMAAGTYEGAAAGNTYISIENFYGTNIASAGDTILGDDNKNYLFGVAGDDTLDGRGGGDVLVGGSGADTLTGGAGVDWFFYASTSESGTTAGTRDLITDFTRGEDLFDLSLIDANPLVSSNQAFNFFGTNAFSGTAGELRYEHAGGNTIVEGDLDGDQVADFSIELVGLHDLTLYDFGAGSVYPFISGTPGDDTLQGGAGDEIIAGGDGDDVLRGGAGNDELYGNGGSDQLYGEEGDDLLEGDDAPFGVPAADLLDGGPGTDEANYYGALAGVVVSLADPSINTGEAAGDTYVSIENLRGSPFDDVLIGDAGDNAIWGEEGDDVLEGGAGADVLDGGDGFDWVSYQSATGGVGVDLATGMGSGAAAGDTFVSIEAIRGSAHDDSLTGDSNDNRINGGEGADVIDGGAGRDVLWYQDSATAITIDFGLGMGLAGEAAGDVFVNIESVEGSIYNDTIYGSAGDDQMWGGAGEDLFETRGGDDIVVGGPDDDRIDFGWSSIGVAVNLRDTIILNFNGADWNVNFAEVGFAGVPQEDLVYLDGIEDVNGTDQYDWLMGSSADNWLVGRGGDDRLYGQGGDDWMRGDDGNDLLMGGAGQDGVDYRTASGGVYLDLLNTISWVWEDGQTYSSNYAYLPGGEEDHIFDVEDAIGSGFGDTLIGSGGANTLAGMEGDDTLQGMGGADTLEGGAGNDTLEGGAANDTLEGGEGADVLDGGAGFDWASYASAASSVSVNLATGAVSGAAAGDTFISIERLIGSAFDDTLIGDDADNVLSGGEGADSIDGGAGRDIIWYGHATAAIAVDLGLGMGLTGEATGDTFIDAESVQGSDFDDLIIGGGAVTEMFGGAGDDVFRIGNAGELVVGEDGSDTVDLSAASEGVHASLFDTEPYDFYGTTYQLNWVLFSTGYTHLDRIENVIGSDFDDTIDGSEEVNKLEGGAGHDTLEGHGGNDALHGGAGNDYLSGGAGDDTHYGDAGDDYILGSVGLDHFYGGDGVDTLDMSYTSASFTLRLDDGYLEFHNNGQQEDAQDFENVIGSTGGDILVGSAADNRLEGNGGDDRIEGAAGSDELWGGAGADRFLFGLGDGVDTIQDFEDGLDLIEFTGLTFGDLSIADEATGARVSFSDFDSVLVEDVLAADLTEDDFLFA